MTRVRVLGADQKKRGLCGRDWAISHSRLRGRRSRALLDCVRFGGHIFIMAFAEQELELQESDMSRAELPKPPEHCTMAILKRWLGCQGARLSEKRNDLIKRSVRSWYIRRLLDIANFPAYRGVKNAV